MFNSSILDMVVLLFFTYFISSVLLSVIMEMIATVSKMRSKELESNLKTLFFDKSGAWRKYVEDKILKSPYYQALQKTDSSKPSYIPAENFAKAVLESFRTDNNPLSVASIQAKIAQSDNLLPPDLQKVVLGYIDTADAKIENLQKQLEGFYDNAMDRAGGWYKRRIKLISFFVALILVALLNIDTIEIIQKSTHNPEALKAEADRISSEVPKMKYSDSTFIFTNSVTHNADTIKIKDGNPTTIAKLQKQVETLNAVKGQLDNKVFSIGYKDMTDFKKEWTGDTCHVGCKDCDIKAKEEDKGKGNTCKSRVCLGLGHILLKLFGLFLTVLALQVGSTYWFDALNKVVNLRGTGKKPEASKPVNP